MKKDLNVCLINDSFPPVIDGVANAVKNYGEIISKSLGNAVVATPYYPNTNDSIYDFPVYRFPSIDTTHLVGYRAGIPFSAETISDLKAYDFDIIHSHCPVASSMLGRVLRDEIDKPLVFTYHTKFDIDIKNSLKGKLIQESALKLLVDNVSAADEVWTVSDGAGKSLQAIGYEGDYIVMPNGVDLPKERVSEEHIDKICSGYDLPKDVPIYLFVGRIVWYKGLKLILDALSKLKAAGSDFRMVFIGNGNDKEDVISYTKKLKLDDKVIFVNSIGDRNILRAWYCKANLFLFPSIFDTNGLVVREAAACSLASVLVKDSCAAEGATDMVNAFLIDYSDESLFRLLLKVGNNIPLLKKIGQAASDDLYFSWEDSVKNAYERYEIVIDNYKINGHKDTKLTDYFFDASKDAIDSIIHIQNIRKNLYEEAKDNIDNIRKDLLLAKETALESIMLEKIKTNQIKEEIKEKFYDNIDRILKEHDRYK